MGGLRLFALVVLLAGVGPAPPAVPVPAAVPAATGFVLPIPGPPRVLTAFAPPPTRYGPGRGVISVEHEGGLRTTYEPVTASVAAGSPVAAGQPIGTLQAGHPGCAPASCLHWGARLPDGTYLDPLALLRPWAVRLWPWDG